MASAASPQGMQLYVFTSGHLTADKSILQTGASEKVTIPVAFFLIKHQKGNVLFDTGQIAIVSLVVPALLGMDRLMANWRGVTALPARSPVAVYGISAVIIGLGSYWFLARTLPTA
ncbi:MAG TPA: hypothetical protein VKF83_01830 [Stellaceae bacterium]|nr:hypothetical protein [Stellaceae bacterium]